jgi:acetyl-CoA/propionyl-CoA carboxylase biotin carboxyl carrier protein
VRDPDFTDEPFRVHNRWIETVFSNDLEPFAGGADAEAPAPRETVVVEVGGRRLEVSLPGGFGAPSAGVSTPKPRRASARAAGAASGSTLTSPMQGTIVKVAVEDGDTVATGDLVVVLEAMKMEQPITAHRGGTVRSLSATVGTTVTSGAVLCEIED